MSQDLKALIGIGIITVLILVGAVFLLSKNSSSASNQKVSDMSLLMKDDSYKTATSSAQVKVNLVEFGDFQCPACGSAHPVVSQILKDYQGQVNLMFRNFPLNIHKNAVISAMAAEAAGAQGKYWEMFDKLYENQTTWAELPDPMETFIRYAKELGLNTNQFQDEIKSSKYKSKIERDYNDGLTLGVNATPTFYVNGVKLEGVPSYNQLKSQIDKELSPK